MGKAVPSRSSTNRILRGLLIGGAIFALTGCATDAPPLPPDQSSTNHGVDAIVGFDDHDRAMSCDDVAKEWLDTNATLAANNSAIEGNRTQNQVAGYFGALFIVPYVATNNNDAEKAKIDQTNQRRDVLIRLAAAKHCPDLK